MPLSPNRMEDKIESILRAWETLRLDKTFGGMTLAQFKTSLEPSFATRALLDRLADQTRAALGGRDAADRASNDMISLIVNAVKGDPAEGDDGELCKAMGYVCKSERKSGLHRAPAAPRSPWSGTASSSAPPERGARACPANETKQAASARALTACPRR